MGQRRPGNATDLRLNLDKIAAPSYYPSPWIFLDGINPWSMVEHANAYCGFGPCPVCEGKPLRKSSYCSGCDATGLDGLVRFPGLAVDSSPDPNWSDPVVTIHRADPSLSGGLGQRVKRRRAVPA